MGKLDLKDESDNDVRRACSSSLASVNVKISRLQLPEQDCRLQHAWQIRIKNCENLPDMDTFSASDPFVEVMIKKRDQSMGPKSTTQVIWNDNNAVFDTTIELACAKPEHSTKLRDTLEEIFGCDIEPRKFKSPEADWTQDKDHECFQRFLADIPEMKRLQARRRESIRVRTRDYIRTRTEITRKRTE